MSQLISFANKLDVLWLLSQKEIIFLDDLQQEFKPDLQTFIVGETLSMKDGKLVVGRNLYKRWLEKIRTRGFDYEIDFK